MKKPSLLHATITLALLVWLHSPTAGAATRTVNNFDDGGPGTLRQAIADSVSGDTITFLPGLGVVTITLTNQLVISKPLTIIGNGPGKLWIDGGGTNRIFLLTNATVKVSDLTLTNGAPFIASGGGGGILNYGTLTLSNCTLSRCYTDSGGGLFNAFGGIATVNNCTFKNGHAGSAGGGIYNLGTLTLNNCSFLGNFTEGYGGGIVTYSTATINGCTFWGNSASWGGGVWNAATMTMNNCTLFGNNVTTASGGHGWGGAIYSSASLTVRHCTISGNTCTTVIGGNFNGSGGGIYQANGPVTILNTIIQQNSANLGRDFLEVLRA